MDKDKGKMLNIIVTIVLGIMFCCLQSASGQAVRRSSFKEFCNETIKCDKSAWLTCKSSSCVCLLEDMIFSSTESKCLSKPGERCRFQIVDVASEKPDVALYGNTECVPHANCANGFTCACNPGFYETMNGTCEEQKDFNASCNANEECRGQKFLKCVGGICACATDRNNFYGLPNNSTEPVCVGAAGKLLSLPGICTNGTILQDGLCTCVPEAEFFAGQDGRCHPRKDFGHNCTENVECQIDRKYFTCVDGKCGCDPNKYIFQQFLVSKIAVVEEEREALGHQNQRPDDDDDHFYTYNYPPELVRGRWLRGEHYGRGFIAVKVNKTIQESVAQCVGLAASPCNPEANCVRDSACNLAEPSPGTCICTPESEFYPADGICHRKKKVNEPCSADEECRFDGYYLTCVSGTCGCDPTKYFYLRSRRGDVIGVNEKMKVRGYGYGNRPDVLSYGTQYLAESGNEVYGTLLTEEYYVSTIRASHVKLLEDSEQCVGLAGKACNPKSRCVQNSGCDRLGEDGNGSCTCTSGFSTTSNGQCGIGHGGNCSHSTPCSDTFRCTNGTCDCPMVNHQVYNPTEYKCFSLALAPCNSPSDCVPNSVCTMNPDTGGKECRCDVGFAENSQGNCERAWGSRCNYTDDIPCDSVAGLKCRNEICSCPDTRSHYNSTIRKCQGLVGSRCGYRQLVGAEHSFCVGGARCYFSVLRLGGQCRCTEEFVVNAESFCDPRPTTQAVTSTPKYEHTEISYSEEYQ